MSIRHHKYNLTLAGADGSAVKTLNVMAGRAGFLRAVAVQVHSQPSTVDVTIKADGSGGATVFAKSNLAADLAAIGVVTDGVDESAGSVADNTPSPFSNGLYFSVAQGDAGLITVEVWVEV